MSFPRVRRLLAVMAVLVLGLVAPAPSLAQEDGVTIDPGSAAGKQYQLPTDDARQVAGGSSSASASDRAAAAQDDGGSGSTTLLIVAVVVVLLAGGGTAFVLRRRA